MFAADPLSPRLGFAALLCTTTVWRAIQSNTTNFYTFEVAPQFESTALWIALLQPGVVDIVLILFQAGRQALERYGRGQTQVQSGAIFHE
jgi:hypothetical protein